MSGVDPEIAIHRLHVDSMLALRTSTRYPALEDWWMAARGMKSLILWMHHALPPDTHAPSGRGENNLLYRVWSVLLESYALRAEKCWGHISENGKLHNHESDRAEHGDLRGRYAGEKQGNDSPSGEPEGNFRTAVGKQVAD
ncbi:hypothetical protein LIER_07114 [Lithospermum erythrorhizon]|uniref:Uncharacterized protein n=1 Tax=Lithospermum erythrorhizon TaxID=34254 RepID=A0AAV3P758_LITER